MTVRKLFTKFPEINTKLWKDTSWSHSYYIKTIGSTNEESVKEYMNNQKKERSKKSATK